MHTYYLLFNATAPTAIYTLSLHDALPIWRVGEIYDKGKKIHVTTKFGSDLTADISGMPAGHSADRWGRRSEEHTSELQSRRDLVCRLLLEKKKINQRLHARIRQQMYIHKM